jgi:DNA-binding NtrC family response regulator
MQVKLLRFLQEGEFQRLGGNQNLKSDIRLVSATNRDLDEEIHKGAFREDLFFRMNVITMKIPPLRERREDIPALLDHFLKCFAKERGTNSRSTG